MALINTTDQSTSVEKQLALMFFPIHALLPIELYYCKRAVTHSDVSLHCAESIVWYTMHCLEYVCVEL